MTITPAAHSAHLFFIHSPTSSPNSFLEQMVCSNAYVTVLKLLAVVAGAMGSGLLRVRTHAAIAFCIDSGIFLSNKKPHLHTVSRGMSSE